ncbi:MAG TPA: 16S rRNA (guanine(966)-N(2))-methyltransferase RsmD [Chthoniobacterales bacterium]
MRIVAGTAGGIQLIRPPEHVRPTMDRVRGAIFSSLGEKVADATVLDLFAGSGGLGLEALSRGAARTTFVDSDSKCGQIIRQNLTRCHLAAAVQNMDVFRFLELYAEENSFDLIFADPPFTKKPGDFDFATALLTNPHLKRALHPEGIFILEKLYSSPRPADLGGWQVRREKRYGECEVLFLARPEL